MSQHQEFSPEGDEQIAVSVGSLFGVIAAIALSIIASFGEDYTRAAFCAVAAVFFTYLAVRYGRLAIDSDAQHARR